MRKWKVMLLALVLGAWSTSAQAATITFDQVIDGGTLAYGGAGGTLEGTAIRLDVIIGADVPNPGTLQCVDCFLNFETGVNTAEGPPTWTFDGGGTFVITGDAFDPITSTTVASGVLLSGSFNGDPSHPTVTGGVGALLAFGFGPDAKHPGLLGFFGVGGGQQFRFANTEISLTNVIVGANGSFSGDVDEADVVNQEVPEAGSTMALLGLGLVGLGTLRRKFLI